MSFLRKREEPPLSIMAVSPASESAAPDFEAVFQEYWGRLCAVLYRLLGDTAEAEDLALEVFLRLYQQPPAQRDQIGGWLYQVSVRLGYNALRGRKRRRKYEDQAGFGILEEHAPADPQMEVERRQERESVRTALAHLKPRSAQILALRYSGLSYAEIAAALDIAPGSVGTLLARAEDEFERQFLEGKK